jgi:hypothetical protein
VPSLASLSQQVRRPPPPFFNLCVSQIPFFVSTHEPSSVVPRPPLNHPSTRDTCYYLGMQLTATSKSTPNRRHPPAGRTRNGSQKVYASENDVPSSKPGPMSPTTPQKSVPSGTTARRTQSTNQTQKNKGGKSRNFKNGLASPGRRQGRESPPLQPQEASAPIFAGSTFHASPAPSALPVPSFLGLPNGGSPGDKARDAPSLTDSDECSPVGDPIRRNDESPLEFFFRADRAEKARVRRASSANTDAITGLTFTPLRNSSREECKTFPRAVPHNSLRRPALTQSNTSPGIPTSELDGSSRLSVGPAFSTPYQERIRAARSTPSAVQSTPITNQTLDPNSSEALKRYLFTGQLGRSAEYGPPHQSGHPSRRVHQVFERRGGTQQGTYLPFQASPFPAPSPAREGLTGQPRAQPTPPVHKHTESSPRSDQILTLEGNLRRMLNLDPLI